MKWLKAHVPLVAVGVGMLALLWFAVRRSPSGGSGSSVAVLPSTSSSNGGGSSAALQSQAISAAVSADQNKNDTVLATAGLAAQVENNRTSAASAIGLQNILSGSQVDLAKVNASVRITELNDNTQLGLAGIGSYTSITNTNTLSARDIAVTGLQTEVQRHQYDTALETSRIDAATAQYLSDANARVAIHGQDSTLTGSLATTAAGVTTDLARTEATRTIALGSQGVQNNYITTQGNTQQLGLNDAAALATHQLNVQQNEFTQVFNALNAGTFNKKGQGGANQVSVIAALFGQPADAAGAHAGAVNPVKGILDGISNVIGSLFGGGGVQAIL